MNELILLPICQVLDVPMIQLMSDRRTQPLAIKRQIACYYLHRDQGLTLRQIGQLLNRSNGSVHYNIRQAHRLLIANPHWSHQYQKLVEWELKAPLQWANG